MPFKLQNQIIYRFGERGTGFKQSGSEIVQDYEQIKSQCQAKGVLFEDLEFQPIPSSVFYTRSLQQKFVWKRPKEISTNPKFFVEGASRFDVIQGKLGDCWLLAAVANLTLNQDALHQVVPTDNHFQDGYCGVFHFRFWRYGKWVEVVIDDLLPCDEDGELLFMHSEDSNEFWSALLEKAYAKLHGSYESLRDGSTCEALEDFTGGVSEMYEIQSAPPNLFNIMTKAYERSSFMGCSIEPEPGVFEAKTAQGLVRGHAYSITFVKSVDIQTPNVSGKIPLIRIRNPWGNAVEWNGAWSDGSREWQCIKQETKEELGLTFDADGEFWMSFKDFAKYFNRLEICNLSADGLEEEAQKAADAEARKSKWEMSIFESAWQCGSTAGGCRKHLETFANNPQYTIDLKDPDENDEDEKCTVIIALMQKYRRAQKKLGLKCLTIGFAVYQIGEDPTISKPLPVRFFTLNASVARTPTFINSREISCRFKLPPGTYCVVPSTFEPNQEGEFLIRVFSEAKHTMTENDTDVGVGELDERVVESTPVQDEAGKRVEDLFKSIAGEDGEIDWLELKGVLDAAMKKEFGEKYFDGFERDVCRSMIALMDVDRSGKLGLQEFLILWKNIRTWQSVFKLYDSDKSGQLNSFELRRALTSAGYQVNNKVLNVLILRYGDKQSGCVWFNDFVSCAVKLKAMIEIFKAKDVGEKNEANFSLDDWIDKTLYS